MAVVADLPREEYVATAGQTTFPFSFPVNLASEIVVYLNSLNTPATLGTHYNVTGIGHPGGGNVVLTTPAAAGDTVVILGVVTIAQGVTMIPHDPFPVSAINNGLDHQARISQMQDEQLGRAPFFAPGGFARNKLIAPPVANAFLRWSADLSTIENTLLTIPTIPVTYPVGTIDANAYLTDEADNPAFDNAGAWAAIIAACPAGGEIIFGPGRYRYSGTIVINKNLTLRGRNRFNSVLIPTTSDEPGIRVSAPSCLLTDFYLHRDTKPIAGGDGIVVDPLCSNTHLARLHLVKQYRGLVLGPVDIARCDALTLQQCESHGVDCDYGTNGAMQWYFTQCLSQHNLGDGFHCENTTAVLALGPFFLDCHTFNNTTGYYLAGSVGHELSDVWILRCATSSERNAGIHFHDTQGKLSMIHNCWIELVGMTNYPRGFDFTPLGASNEGHGLRTTGFNGELGALNIVGGTVWACAWSGVALDHENAHVVGMTLIDNGQGASGVLANRAGLVLVGNSAQVSGCSFLKTLGNGGQSKGIVMGGVTGYLGISPSNLFVGYLPDAMVDTSLATLSGTVAAIAPLGLFVNTGVLNFVLNDETGGPTPTKTMRVSGGHFEMLNAAGDTVIVRIGNNGLLAAPTLGVGNSEVATTPGTVVRKIQIFEHGSGGSLGFIPVYNTIT